jgi:hypothetical protein
MRKKQSRRQRKKRKNDEDAEENDDLNKEILEQLRKQREKESEKMKKKNKNAEVKVVADGRKAIQLFTAAKQKTFDTMLQGLLRRSRGGRNTNLYVSGWLRALLNPNTSIQLEPDSIHVCNARGCSLTFGVLIGTTVGGQRLDHPSSHSHRADYVRADNPDTTFAVGTGYFMDFEPHSQVVLTLGLRPPSFGEHHRLKYLWQFTEFTMEGRSSRRFIEPQKNGLHIDSFALRRTDSGNFKASLRVIEMGGLSCRPR